jgi:BTB/POZ domain
MDDRISKAMEQLLRKGHSSDFTITCRSKEFKAHQVIINGQSPFFHVVINQPFKVRMRSVS